MTSDKGHGGGWSIARDLTDLTLRDIYQAIGSPALFAIGNRDDTPGCAVERAVNTVLSNSLRDAKERLLAMFGAVTLADLSAAFHHSLPNCAPDAVEDLRHGH